MPAINRRFIARGLQLIVSMCLVVIVFGLLTSRARAAGDLEVDWIKNFGGSVGEVFASGIIDSSGNIVLAGETSSNDGDVAGLAKGDVDGLVVKYDVNGNLQWKNVIGGSTIDAFLSIEETPDNNYLAIGYSDSTDQDLSGLNKGSTDIFLALYDQNGNLLLKKNFGGSGGDFAYSGKFDQGGNLLLVGQTSSNDGDFLNMNKGDNDAFVIKLDQSYNLIWSKTFGGSMDDRFFSVDIFNDNEFVAVGYSSSTDGDRAGYTAGGGTDAILVKFNQNGDFYRQAAFGGSNDDEFSEVQIIDNNEIICVGSSDSNDGSISSPRGGYDLVVIKYDQNLNTSWYKTHGGSGDDLATSILQNDSGYLITGISNSNDGDLQGLNKGGLDWMIINIGLSGNLVAPVQTLGGSALDRVNGSLKNNSGDIFAYGMSLSTDGDFAGLNKGGSDGILVKYNLPNPCTDPANAQLLSCQALGTTVTITGQGGAEYKWIKMSEPGAGDSYWMLADNYCMLTNAPSICVDKNNTPAAPYQVYNPVADSRGWYNDWTTLTQTPGSVYQQVLQPLFNDLPAYIGGLPKNQAIPEHAFDSHEYYGSMGGCVLTANPQADLTNCTWTDRLSLIAAFEWGGPPLSSAQAYCQTRFGTDCNNGGAGGLFTGWTPWTRTPMPAYYDSVHYITDTDAGAFYDMFLPNSNHGVSPVLYLSSALTIATPTGGQDGSYANPFELNTPEDFVFRVANYDQDQTVANHESINIYGSFDVARAGRVEIRATIAGVEKVATIIVNSGDNLQNIGYALTWNAGELPAGTYGGPTDPIVVSATFDSPATALTINYTGLITTGVEDLPQESIILLDLISNLLKVRYAGTIFVPETYQPGVHALLQDYNYHSTLDGTHQVWTKQITHQLTSETRTYPFLVETFPLPTGDSVVGK